MLIPQQQNLTAYIGGTFSGAIQLYKDAAKTKKYEITGVVKADIESIKTLEEGKGITVNKPEGIIELVMTWKETEETLSKLTQTSLDPPRWENIHYYISIETGEEEEIVFPVHGNITFETP